MEVLREQLNNVTGEKQELVEKVIDRLRSKIKTPTRSASMFMTQVGETPRSGVGKLF